jgi:hypothetical protein
MKEDEDGGCFARDLFASTSNSKRDSSQGLLKLSTLSFYLERGSANHLRSGTAKSYVREMASF